MFFRHLLLAVCCFCSLSSLAAQADSIPALHYAWETDSIFPTVESVGYDPVSEMIYTTNINGHFMARDGNGSIGRMRPDGQLSEPAWVTGLDAPTGICFHDGKLYTTDIDRLVEIDLATATITRTLPLPGAKALNDITVSPEGVFYLSDTGGDQIFSVRGNTVSVYQDEIKTPNGLVYVRGALFVTLWTPRELAVINHRKQVYRFYTGIPESDGLQVLPNGDFLIAGWGGEVYHLTRPRSWGGKSARTGMVHSLLNFRGSGVHAPDVCFLPESGQLFVPTFDHHRIRAYNLRMTSLATDPYPLPERILGGMGLNQVTNSADPERELYQQQVYQGKELGVYVISSETKTATYEDHPIDELLFVLDGRARLRPRGEMDRFFLPGEHFLVPQNYRGDWETQGGDGLYYELSVIGLGEETFPAPAQVQHLSSLALAGNPPEGRAPADTLMGKKLRIFLSTDAPGERQLVTEREQLIKIVSGTVRLRQQGKEWTFRKGDFFFLPAGFQGSWRVLGPRPLRCLRVERRKE